MTAKPPQLVNQDGDVIRKGRISPALATVCRLLVEEGITQAEAAKRTGYKAPSLSIALRKPHVKAYLDSVRRAWKENRTSRAWVNVADLADNAASEDVRLKANRTFLEAMGELGGGGEGDGKAPSQLIQIIANHVHTHGHPLSERLPGVVERPPLLDITPHRQTRDESDGSE